MMAVLISPSSASAEENKEVSEGYYVPEVDRTQWWEGWR